MPEKKYEIQFHRIAKVQFSNLGKREKSIRRKAGEIINSLESDPYDDRWGFKPLKDLEKTYSKRLSRQNRICYEIHEIDERKVIITVLSILGHYGDH